MKKPLNLIDVIATDFRKSEVGHIQKVMKGRKLSNKDTVCFVSKGSDQILFVRRPTTLEISGGVPKKGFMSTKHRLVGGKWNIELFLRFIKEMDDVNIEPYVRRLKEYFHEKLRDQRKAA